VVYEVNLDVDGEVRDEFLSWLSEHVEEMLALEGFLGAEVYERSPEDDGAGQDAGGGPPARLLVTVHYRVRSRDALGAYFRDHAPRMREDGLRRFGGRFRASRRVLERLARAGMGPQTPG
jgi:hypothetical protein